MSILQKTADAYILWHKNANNLSRFTRGTLGMKIDNFFTELISVLLRASFAVRDQKILLTGTAAKNLDLLKYFLYLMYRSGGLDSKKYIEISMLLSEIGKMLGGWRKQLLKTEGASRS